MAGGGLSFGLKIVLAAIGLFVVGFVVMHLPGHGLGGHGH